MVAPMGPQRIILETLKIQIMKPQSQDFVFFIMISCSFYSGSLREASREPLIYCHSTAHSSLGLYNAAKILILHFLLINLLHHRITCSLQKQLRAFLSGKQC